MAPSLRDLIDFLLAEIALCGTQGASTADILSFINLFYAKCAKDGSGHAPVVDRRFQEKVWQWLTKNPEVSVGKDREGNGLSLEQAERRQQASGNTEEKPLNVFVSLERTWLAITGHEPDDTKVLPMEFALLSIIASRKSSGISQPDLIKLSGQDKRSVPKRTDVLQQKGYIEKRAIQLKGARTSLCTLRKFISQDAGKSAAGTSDGPNAVKMIDFNSFTDTLFGILREHKIISRNDLKRVLGFNDHWHWKVLSRALRKFERIGVVKRVKAMSQYAKTMKKYHPCVMLVREPTAKDIELFHDFSIHMYSDIKQNDEAEFEDDAEAEEATGEAPAVGDIRAMEGEQGVEASGRVLPLWSPDRVIHNQLFEVVDRAGTMGSTNSDVIKTFSGVLWRRPLENTLARLSECWQLSQPPHLRHLALVRDTALQRTITHYIHYSARNFSKLVEAGESSWEAVEFIPRNNRSNTVSIPPVHAETQLDAYGLPQEVPANDLVKNGDCSLSDCMWVVKPKDYNISSSDPKAVELDDGTYAIQYGIKGHSVQSPAGRLATPDTPSLLEVEKERASSIDADLASTPVPKRLRKIKRESQNFAGMSELEKLKAMGLDESWTEYSVLLIDRQGPGVYVTPRGRRKPAGKERGRPPTSRIAVFKSTKLLDLPWFRTDSEGLSIARPASQSPEPFTVDPRLSATTVRGAASPRSVEETNVVHGTKRSHQHDSGSESGPLSPKAQKLRRTGHISNDLDSQEPVAEDIMADEQASEAHAHEARTPSRIQGKRKRTSSPESGHQDGIHVRKRGGQSARPSHDSPATDGDGPKGPRRKLPTRQTSKASKSPLSSRKNGEFAANSIKSSPKSSKPVQYSQSARSDNTLSVSQSAIETPTGQNRMLESPQLQDGTPLATVSGTAAKAPITASSPVPSRLQSATPAAFQAETSASNATPTPETSSRRATRSKLVDKGGSVAFLRRRIVMDLVEKAGGAFPMGSELWYPFVTAWMKTKYKEKPDMRTLRNAVKHLVDAGKLRQQTFCGKDSKGVMVTKTIICKAELAPDDPIIKEMQEKILASGARHYFPPGVDVDPNLTKQGTGSKLVRGGEIPVEPGLTVQLHNKPALVQALEKRKGATIQRRLNRRLEIEQMRESMQEVRPSGVIRLLSRPRPDWYIPPSGPGMAPLLTDDPSFGALRKHGGRRHRPSSIQTVDNRQLKRINFSLSLLAPYAMLMSPAQSFNPLNGTYSTDAGLATFSSARAPQSRAKQVLMARATLMLMNPYQTFNPSNGTFSTNAGLAALFISRSIQRSSYSRSTRKQEAHLPHSLDDQLMQAGRRNIRIPGETDSRSRDFIRDTNAILRWELQNERLLQERSKDVRYINHGIRDFFESAPIEGGIRFHPEEMGFIYEEPAVGTRRQTGSSPAFTLEEHPVFPPPPARDTMRMRHYIPPPPPRPRRLEKLNEMLASGNESTSPSASRTQLRRNRLPLPFSRSSYQKLMTAIVAVRALAGGSNGNIVDWPLVSCCFPEQDSKVIQDKGKIFLAKNRLQIAKMQYDFQERFVDAYANNEVPQIDYNNLEGYDWNAVIEWANANLDVPKSDRTPDLPATREQFDNIFELREEPLGSLDELYQTTTAVTLNRKKQLISNIAFAAPLPHEAGSYRSQRRLELSRFEAVKTCVRANVFTPAEVYRATDARNTLSRIDNGLLNNALQSLITERVISQANKGRVVPGRNYDITDYFIQTLSKKRPIEATDVRRASKFKTETLDPALTQQGVFSVAFNAEDGDILALINLFSEGRIKLAPRDPPRDKFGLTEGGYLTRMMNKDKLRFPVDVYPVAGKYATGNPVSEKASSIPRPCPPRVPIIISTDHTGTGAGTVSVPEKYPLWLDIHGGFIQVLWDLAVGAIVGTVAVRPGISAKQLASAIRPTMGDWEVLMVLKWLTDVGVVRKSGGYAGPGADADEDTDEACWFVREWWWMVLS
ncbi:putative TFIIIC transcription initiation factor complex subunits Tfc3 [Aspergillus foveolatus]|uniref:putative TFIIIC transcription initiation factor complex subunits Tfc3 n=1 Tax=Aspergillus foveolatus TaxID=210207 RepID=UPI003CCCFE81